MENIIKPKQTAKNCGKWIKENRKRLKVTQTQLGDQLSVTKGTVSSWESGKFVPKLEPLLLLSSFFDKPLPDEFTIQHADLQLEDSARIPLLDSTLDNEEGKIMASSNLQKNCFAYTIRNNDVAPCLEIGDIVIVDDQRKCEVDNICLISFQDKYIFRRFRQTDAMDSSKFELFSTANTNLPIINSEKHPCEIIGVVVEIRKNTLQNYSNLTSFKTGR